MNEPDPVHPSHDEDSRSSDLARSLARYRLRVEAEGRPRSLELIDRAIDRAGRKRATNP